MITVDLNEPDEALVFLTKPLVAVQHALDHGLSFTEQVMSELDKNPWLHADLVRSVGLQYLKKLPDKDSWRLGRDLPNSGIEIICGPVVFRVFKSQDDTPPHPGRNSARQDFWSQKQLQFSLEINGITVTSGANLLVDWIVGEDQRILLALSKPDGTWEFRGQPKLKWRRHVVLADEQSMKFVPVEEDIEVEINIDLDEISEADDVG